MLTEEQLYVDDKEHSFKIVDANDVITVYIDVIGTSELSRIKEGLYFYNRLFVKPEFRNKGYGRQLYDKTCEYLNSKHYTLMIGINPYGDLSYDQLLDFYSKNKFCKQGEISIMEGGLIRYPK